MGSTDVRVIGSDEGTYWECLTWLVVNVLVVGWMFDSVGYHVTSKGAELSCQLDYTIPFWSWILSWKSLYFVEISTFCGYYLHFLEISTFRGYYLHFVDIYVLRGYYFHSVEISMFCRYYPHFLDISTSCGYYPHFLDNIYIDHITSYLARNVHPVSHIYSFSEIDWCISGIFNTILWFGVPLYRSLVQQMDNAGLISPHSQVWHEVSINKARYHNWFFHRRGEQVREVFRLYSIQVVL